MPARSQKQARTMRAAAAGADFPLAKKLRQTMTPKQLAEFSHTAKSPSRAQQEHYMRPAMSKLADRAVPTPEHKTRAAGKQRAALKPHTESHAYNNRDGRRRGNR